MIRVLLQSSRPSLEPLLGATLGAGIALQVESTESKVFELMDRKQVDVVIVDLEFSAQVTSGLTFISRVRESGLPVLAITDDERRSTSLELLERGVSDQFRNPPSPFEMTLAIRRVHEHTQMRRELAAARRALSQTGGFEVSRLLLGPIN